MVVARDRQPGPEIGDRDLVVVGEAVQGLEARRVRVVAAVEHPDFPRGAEPQARREEVADIERGADHELAVAQIGATPHPEAEQADACARRRAAHARRLELLRTEPRREQRRPNGDPHASHHVSLPDRGSGGGGSACAATRAATRP